MITQMRSFSSSKAQRRYFFFTKQQILDLPSDNEPKLLQQFSIFGDSEALTQAPRRDCVVCHSKLIELIVIRKDDFISCLMNNEESKAFFLSWLSKNTENPKDPQQNEKNPLDSNQNRFFSEHKNIHL